MMKLSCKSKLFSNVKRVLLIFCFVILICLPGTINPKPAEGVGPMAIVAGAATVAQILEYGYKIVNESQGATSVKINRQSTQKQVWADIGDVIQIPIDITFTFKNTWSLSREEWIYFEYLVFYDGEIIYQQRIPETGYAAKDNDCMVQVQNQLLLGVDKWFCQRSNAHKLKIKAIVYDDGYYKQNDKGPTWQNHSYFQKKSVWDAKPEYRWINVNAHAQSTTELIVMNPYFGSDYNFQNDMDHTGPVGRLWMNFHLNSSHDAGGESIVTHPGKAEIVIDDVFESKDGWKWEPSAGSTFTVTDHQIVPLQFKGAHLTPDHPGKTLSYFDTINLKAKGKFTTPPKPSLSTSERKSYEGFWEDKTWETSILFDGKKQDGTCFPGSMRSQCMQRIPYTAPPAGDGTSIGEGGKKLPGTKPGSKAGNSGEIGIPGDASGGITKPGEVSWPGRKDDDGKSKPPPDTKYDKRLIDPGNGLKVEGRERDPILDNGG